MIPAHPVSNWQYFDLVSVGAISIMLAILLITHHRQTGSLLGTVSATVAYSKSSSLIFAIVATLFSPLYVAFLWFWVSPLTSMAGYFYYLLLLSAICELILVWVPSTEGNSKKIHGIAASLVAIAMPFAALLLLSQGSNLHSAAKVSIYVFLTLVIALAILLVSKKFRKYTFLYESLYCISFVIVMSVIAHT